MKYVREENKCVVFVETLCNGEVLLHVFDTDFYSIDTAFVGDFGGDADLFSAFTKVREPVPLVFLIF